MTDVESLTASLVREYLSRKGLKSVLHVLDKEMPRTDDSISNRAQLAKEIHIEKLMKKNKEQSNAYRTMLEVVVQYLKDKGGTQSTTSSTTAIGGAHASNTEPHLAPAKTSAKERKTSREKPKKIESPTSPTEQSSETQDYSDLLKRLEKSEAPPRRTEVSKPMPTREHTTHKSPTHTLENFNSDVQGSLVSGEKSSRVKSQRSRIRSTGLGGPVISSGLAGLGDKRQRHRNHTLDINITGQNFHLEKDKGFTDDKDHSDVDDIDRLVGSTSLEVKKGVKKDTTQEVPKNEDTTSFHQSMNSGHSKKTLHDKTLRSSFTAGSGTVKDELVFEDIDDDFDQDLRLLSLGPSNAITADFESKPISLEQAMSLITSECEGHARLQSQTFGPHDCKALKNLIFGTATACFNPEWKQQGFSFCDLHGLEFGIVQLKGGPCGVLAAVQGFVIKHLLFGENKRTHINKRNLQPSSRERTKALVSAITEILWRAGGYKTAIAALPTGLGSSNFIGAGRYKPDQLTENLVLRTFKSQESLQGFISQQISQFEGSGRSGCILLLYSTILSRSIKRIISDMDEPTNKLMGAHGYCTQEMVNVLITGKASSNVFDNVIELDSGGTSKMILRGIDKQADIGLLSLFEHYGSCQVGINYKSPRLPIWVICSESHFSVLFSTNRELLDDWQLNKEFDLYYYDGLARQDEEIKLTVDTTQECPEYVDGDLVPPLELVIRTKWKKASVDWNGAEPIL